MPFQTKFSLFTKAFYRPLPRSFFSIFVFLLPFLLAGVLHAQKKGTQKKTPEQVLMEIQRELVDLDRQFEEIREDLFFPKDAEVLVYLRSKLKETFPVKMVDLMVDGKRVYRHTYSDSEKIAFNFSSLQPLYRFTLKPGQYQMALRFTVQPQGESKSQIQEHQFMVKKEKIPRFIEVELDYNSRRKELAFAEKIY